MLTIEHKRTLDADDVFDGRYYIEGTCLSTDEKPTDCKNGSKLIEMDTSKRYVFDEENSEWLEYTGGGGGGGSQSNVLYFDNSGNSYIG